jgi:methionyl-tRNA formyltransferase
MRLLLLTQSAPVYLAPFLDDLLAGLADSPHEVVAVGLAAPFFKRSRWAEVRERWGLYGPLGFIQMAAYIALTKLRATWNPRYSVAKVFAKHTIPIQMVDKVNSPAFIEWVQAQQIDLIISIAFPKILKPALLETPPQGCINYHTGLLPRYRGRMPLYWALLQGEREVGITVHEMDSGIDSGPIIEQARVPIEPSDSLHQLYLKTTAQGVGVLLRAIAKVGQGDTSRLINDPAQATYFGFPSLQEAQAFRRKGRRFF